MPCAFAGVWDRDQRAQVLVDQRGRLDQPDTLSLLPDVSSEGTSTDAESSKEDVFDELVFGCGT